jgi:hypothetical protein
VLSKRVPILGEGIACNQDSVEQNYYHLVSFGIFSHVNFPAPLYSFSSDLEVLSKNVANQIDNYYNLTND